MEWNRIKRVGMARDLFRVVVATMGLVVLWYGVFYFLDGAVVSAGFYEVRDVKPAYYVTLGFVHLLAGMALMKGNRILADIAFPEEDFEQENNLVEPGD